MDSRGPRNFVSITHETKNTCDTERMSSETESASSRGGGGEEEEAVSEEQLRTAGGLLLPLLLLSGSALITASGCRATGVVGVGGDSDDTAGDESSLPLRSRLRFGTRPYRTAGKAKSNFILEIFGDGGLFVFN